MNSLIKSIETVSINKGHNVRLRMKDGREFTGSYPYTLHQAQVYADSLRRDTRNFSEVDFINFSI